MSADHELFVTLRRDDDADTKQVIRWATPVTYLQLDRGVNVHVADETGPDWPGADEPELELYIDNEHLLKTAWDDADTGEDLHGLAEHIRAEAVQRGWTSPSIAFCHYMDVVILEPDDVTAAHGCSPGRSRASLRTSRRSAAERSPSRCSTRSRTARTR